MILATFLLVFVWLICSVLTWGSYCGAHRAAEYRWLIPNHGQLAYLTVFGPIGLTTTILMGEFGRHWSWYPPKKEECWKYWIEKGYGENRREEFEAYQKDRA